MYFTDIAPKQAYPFKDSDRHLCLRKDNERECKIAGSKEVLQLEFNSMQRNVLQVNSVKVNLIMKNIIIFISQDIHSAFKNIILWHSVLQNM